MQERLNPGATLDGFTILEQLGEGGLGIVYRARSPDGHDVAIKVAKRHAGQNPTRQLINQQNELETLMRLRHPSVVRVHGFGSIDDGSLYIAMELVRGTPLHEVLASRRRFDLLEAIAIMRRVVDALAHCHAQNVVHLDLKPHNILLIDPHLPTLKVLDFGISRLGGGWQSGAGALAGTIGYLAPECFSRQVDTSLDFLIDLYAVGAIFYELLTGVRPFAGKRPLRRHVPSIPAELEELVDALLCASPKRRYPSAAKLSRELHDLYYATLRAERPVPGEEHDGASQVPAAARGDEAPSAPVPFVGREDELRALVERFEAVVDGSQGGSLVLVGEAGIGKSRLLAEGLQRFSAEGALVAYGRCRELGALVPYSSLREALVELSRVLLQMAEPHGQGLRRVAEETLAGGAAPLAGLVPELLQLADSASSDAPTPKLFEGGTRLVSAALGSLLGALAEQVPVVLVIEDLHWADEGTLGLLEHLIEQGLHRVLVLGSSRPGASWLSRGGLDLLALPLLGAEANDKLLSALVGADTNEVLSALKASVPLLDAGNPLFNVQVCQHLEAEGHLVRAGDDMKLVLDPDRGYRAPNSISAALSQRLDRLPRAQLRVLAIAALIDREFRRSDVHGLGLFEASALDEAVMAASRLHLLTSSGDRCVFTHDAIREELATTVPAAERAAVHARIARQLQSRGAAPGTLAYHLEHGGDGLAAAAAYFEAALDADRLHSPVDACNHLHRALQLLAELRASAERDQRTLLAVFQLSRIGCQLGDIERTQEAIDRTIATLGLDRERLPLELESAITRLHYVRGDWPSAITTSRRCLAAGASRPGAGFLLGFPANVIGRALCATGKVGAAVDPLRRGCQLAQETGELAELCHSQGMLGVALGYVGEHEEARELLEASLRLARRIEDPVRLQAAYVYYAMLAETAFDWELGVKYSTLLLSYSEERKVGGQYLYMGTIFAGRHQFHLGHYERARVLLKNAIHLAETIGTFIARGWAWSFLGDVELASRGLEEARLCYDSAVTVGRLGSGDEYATGLGRAGLAHHAALASLGVDAVREEGEQAVQCLEKSSNNSALLTVLQRYALALETAGDVAGGGAIAKRYREMCARFGVPDVPWCPRPT